MSISTSVPQFSSAVHHFSVAGSFYTTGRIGAHGLFIQPDGGNARTFTSKSTYDWTLLALTEAAECVYRRQQRTIWIAQLFTPAPALKAESVVACEKGAKVSKSKLSKSHRELLAKLIELDAKGRFYLDKDKQERRILRRLVARGLAQNMGEGVGRWNCYWAPTLAGTSVIIEVPAADSAPTTTPCATNREQKIAVDTKPTHSVGEYHDWKVSTADCFKEFKTKHGFDPNAIRLNSNEFQWNIKHIYGLALTRSVIVPFGKKWIGYDPKAAK